jgi:hypothetical protein
LKFVFFQGKLRANRKIGADKVAVGLALEGDVLEAKFEAGDFVLFGIGDQPIVGIAALFPSLKIRATSSIEREYCNGFASANKIRECP